MIIRLLLKAFSSLGIKQPLISFRHPVYLYICIYPDWAAFVYLMFIEGTDTQHFNPIMRGTITISALFQHYYMLIVTWQKPTACFILQSGRAVTRSRFNPSV